jgi:photosynthetic reaction center cytochrome c subunit
VNVIAKASFGLLGTLLFAGAIATYKSTTSVQLGNPGLAMEIIGTREELAQKVKDNTVPPALPEASKDGMLAVDAYKNVKVLGHLSSGDLTRLMTAITIWVAPEAGCGYCHAPERDDKGNVLKNDQGYALADLNHMDSDELYTKQVARRMIQMTMRINEQWQDHVKDTGVTCFTCHRGNSVPKNIWFDVADTDNSTRFQGLPNLPNEHGTTNANVVGLTALPSGALHPFLVDDENIRIQSTEAVGSDNRASIKQAEWTYGLMIHMTKALGVNCTFCHNTRSIGEWSTSPATRAQAWHGIRMVRELNNDFLLPLASTLPKERLGSLGDGPKVNCATCHAGSYKPLLGVSMLKDYQALAKAMPQPEKTMAATPMDNNDDGGTAMTATDGGAGSQNNIRANDANALDGGSKSPVPGKTQTQTPAIVKPQPANSAAPSPHQ